jgi:poly-gamma-glutamate capsule biosynthesis protein CapA/YwtB (metallophosphatase superfamily)
MRNNLILIRILILFAFLAGCGPRVTPADPGTEILAGSETRTPFLPAAETPSIPFLTETPTITPSPTDTPSPTGTSTGTPTPSMQVNLQAVGDIMMARTIGDLVLTQGPGSIFAGVQSVLDTADVLVGNLECAITNGGEPQPKIYTFAAPPAAAQALGLAGFDILSLANNHAMDYGSPGLLDTRNNLGQYGIASVGAGANAVEAHAPVILERNGLHMAFLAFVDVPNEFTGFDTHTWIATDTRPGVAWAYRDQIKADVTAAKLLADVVVVFLHSGYEMNDMVVVHQRAEAITAIDAGAALVIGSHPHILQGVEKYHGGLIAYSLGNFVFDDNEGISNASVILQVLLTRQGVENYHFVPVLIENGLPRLAADWEAPAIGTMVSPINP